MSVADVEAVITRCKLHDVCDSEPGIRRVRCGKGFSYRHHTGRTVKDEATRRRIDALAIPPAWEEVWICSDPRGYLQATGRDDKGRKQYIYHEEYSEAANLAKFDHLIDLAEALPTIRRTVQQDLERPLGGKRHALAAMVALLDASGIRVGNEEYAQQNGSYGLCTLCRRHLKVKDNSLALQFPGKSGQHIELNIQDERLARVVHGYLKQHDLPRVFAWMNDDNQWTPLDADDVNQYLGEITSREFTAKDLRTWKATALVAQRLYEKADVDSQRKRKQILLESIDAAAELLGNTRAVCRQYYVHPGLQQEYLNGRMAGLCSNLQIRRRKWMPRTEQVALALLQAV